MNDIVLVKRHVIGHCSTRVTKTGPELNPSGIALESRHTHLTKVDVRLDTAGHTQCSTECHPWREADGPRGPDIAFDRNSIANAVGDGIHAEHVARLDGD